MHIIKNKSSRQKLFYLVAMTAIVITLGVGGYYMSAKKPTPQPAKSDPTKANSVDYSSPTKEQQDAGYDAKKAALEPPTPPPSSQNAAPITITSVNQSGDTLTVRTMIETTEADGNCTLEMTKTGSTAVTQQAGTQSLGSYYVCQGFDIPTANLTKGDWTITVTYKKDAKSSSASKAVTVN